MFLVNIGQCSSSELDSFSFSNLEAVSKSVSSSLFSELFVNSTQDFIWRLCYYRLRNFCKYMSTALSMLSPLSCIVQFLSLLLMMKICSIRLCFMDSRLFVKILVNVLNAHSTVELEPLIEIRISTRAHAFGNSDRLDSKIFFQNSSESTFFIQILT